MAFEWSSWSFESSFVWQYNGEIGSEADRKQPSRLMFSPGAFFHGDFDGTDGGWFLRPGFRFTWGAEDLEQGIARPSDEAEADHMKVLGLMTSVTGGYAFQAGSLDIGVQGGPMFYFRFPLWTAQLGTAEPADFWKAYYARGEFLHFGISAWVGIPVAETMDFEIGLGMVQPFSVIWTAAPFFHGTQAMLTASLSFDIPGDS